MVSCATPSVAPEAERSQPPLDPVSVDVQKPIFTRAEVVGKPAVPKYPRALRNEGIEGRVMLLVTVDVQGTVAEIEVFKAPKHVEFTKVAIEAAKRDRYRPASRNGTPIQTRLRRIYRFVVEP